jgi:hypothetical protein
MLSKNRIPSYRINPANDKRTAIEKTFIAIIAALPP